MIIPSALFDLGQGGPYLSMLPRSLRARAVPFLLLMAARSSMCEPEPALTDAALFERWSHFKDLGIPGTAGDALNRAAIADGSCRLLGPDLELDGYALWKAPFKVDAVLAALTAAPDTTRPSYFVHSTREALAVPCRASPAEPSSPVDFDAADLGAALQNWHRALCAPAVDETWGGEFDPADQPQQMALTVGFACIVACDANGRDLSAASMAALLEDPSGVRDAVCGALPWPEADRFDGIATRQELARSSEPLLELPCSCGGGAAANGERPRAVPGRAGALVGTVFGIFGAMFQRGV